MNSVNKSYFPYSFKMACNYIIDIYNFIIFIIYKLISFTEVVFQATTYYTSVTLLSDDLSVNYYRSTTVF